MSTKRHLIVHEDWLVVRIASAACLIAVLVVLAFVPRKHVPGDDQCVAECVARCTP